MTEPDTDPLALRHGALIAEIWTQIAHARAAARKAVTQDRAAFWRHRLRRMANQVRDAQCREMARLDLSTAAIEGWFLPVFDTLEKAEKHFDAILVGQTAQTARQA